MRNNVACIRRRKRQRDAAIRDYRAIAARLGLKLEAVRGIRPEVFQDAVALLHEARDVLPPDVVGYVNSASPANGIFIVVGNASGSVSQS